MHNEIEFGISEELYPTQWYRVSGVYRMLIPAPTRPILKDSAKAVMIPHSPRELSG